MRFATPLRKSRTKLARRATGLLAAVLLTGGLPASAADSDATVPVPVASPGPATVVGTKPFTGFVPGQSVEDISKRTAQAKTFRNPDGSYTDQISSDVEHYWSGTRWAEISNRLVPDTAGGYRNEANAFTVRFRASEVALDTPQGTITLTPAGATLGMPVLDPVAETVTYADVWPGVDVRYRVVSRGVKEELVVRQRPATTQFSFRLQGAALNLQGDGGVAMGGAFAGKWKIPAPEVFARDGKPLTKTGARFAVAGNTVTLAVDRTWLTGLDEAKDLPVVLDPSILSVGSTTGRSYLRNPFDDGYTTCDSVPTPCQVMVGIQDPGTGWRPWRSVQYFPYESLYGKQILKGQVILQSRQEGTPDPKVMKIYGDDVNGQFGGIWNWSNLGAKIGPDGTASGDTFIYDENDGGPLGAYYQDLVNRQLPYMAIKFVGDETPGNYTFKRFAWFQLQLTYNTPPNVPDSLSQGWASGFAAPELSARFTDPDGDNGNVDFEVTRPDGSKIFQPVGTTNGGTARFTPAVSAPGTYSWHVRAWDGRTLSRNPEWSGDRTFTIIADVAPNVPDNLAPDNNAASASEPTLSARYTAGDGQAGWIEFDMGGEDEHEEDRVPAANNATATYTPAVGEGTWSWRARATDGRYASAWTPWRYFSVRPGLVWYESFSGNNGDLWNNTRWSAGTNNLSRTVDIQNNEGRLYVNGSSAGVTAKQNASSDISLADIDAAFTYRFENNDPRSFLRIRTRNSGTNAYRVELRSDSTTIKLQNIINGVTGQITQFTYNPDGQPGPDPGNHRLRIQAQGSTVRVKAWPANTLEPDSWQIDRPDTSVTGPGTFKIDHNYDTGSRSIYLDDVAITNLQVQGGTVAELPMQPKYPSHGFGAIATSNDAFIGLSSDRCKQAELDAIAQIKATTEGSQPEFGGAWPNGIQISRSTNCQGFVGDDIDILLDYMDPEEYEASGHTDSGAEVHPTLAPPEYCDSRGYTKLNSAGNPDPNGKCGQHFSLIHVNEVRFDNYPSALTRRNLLIHETGHSFGFIDSCKVDAITNNGRGKNCGLPEGWTSIDRREMKNKIYPAFPYPRQP